MFKMKKGLVLLIGLVSIFALTACNNENDEPEDEVIATVNEENIYESTWEKSVDRMILSYQQQGMDVESEQGQMLVEQIETQALEQLINQTLLYQEAKANDLEVDTEDAQADLNELKQGYESEEAFASALETHLFTEDEFLTLLQTDLSITAYLEATLDDITVSEEEKLAYYVKYIEQIEEEEDIPAYVDVEENIEAQLAGEAEQEQITLLLEDLKASSDIEKNL